MVEVDRIVIWRLSAVKRGCLEYGLEDKGEESKKGADA